MKFIKSILNDIKKGENIDGYLALSLGLICSFIGIFDIQLKYVLAAISTVLTLLALGILIDRKNTRKISELLNNVAFTDSKALDIRSKEYFYNYIFESINGAEQEICMLVRSGSTIKNCSQELEQAIHRGCRVRIILCARNSETIGMMAFRGYSTTEPSSIINEIEISINKLKSLKKEITSSKKKLLEVKEIKYIPSIGLSISDPESTGGKLFALLVSFRSRSRSGPSILLYRENNPDLFNYFKEEFDNYWNAAEEIAELK